MSQVRSPVARGILGTINSSLLSKPIGDRRAKVSEAESVDASVSPNRNEPRLRWVPIGVESTGLGATLGFEVGIFTLSQSATLDDQPRVAREKDLFLTLVS